MEMLATLAHGLKMPGAPRDQHFAFLRKEEDGRRNSEEPMLELTQSEI
jgi:hypothetical protein